MAGRKTLFFISLGMLVLLAALFHYLGAATVWSLWSVPTKYGGLADLREVLQGIQLAQGAGGSGGLVSGYPGIWGLLGWLGLSANDTVGAAVVMFCAFAAGMFIFARRYDSVAAVLISAIVFSPAAMLGYERANLDLAMFSILALALWVGSISALLPVGLIVLAGMLKVYPILGLGYLLKQPRGKFLLWTGIAVAVFALYLVVVGRGTQTILTEIPKGGLFAYGTGVGPFYLYWMGLSRPQTNVVILLIFVLLYLLAILVLYGSYKRGVHERLMGESLPWLDAFRLGALIYLGTFVEGNSFNYRLLFLVFCIPQLAAWARRVSPVWFEARLTTVALIASCWTATLLWFLPEGAVLVFAQIANWILFTGLLYLLIVSLPDWIFGEIQRFFRKYERSARSTPPLESDKPHA